METKDLSGKILKGGLDALAQQHISVNQHNSDVETIKGKLDDLLSKYKAEDLPTFHSQLSPMLRRIERCRKEFDSTRFFVLIVGPLKSGKSTFVNILASKQVSPTDTLECTAVPTIIGKASGAALNSITKYIKSPTSTASEVEVFGNIIDVLRGIESPEILTDCVSQQVLEATEGNIIKTVANSDSSKSTQTPIVATIGIEGSNFIDDEIMIIDMPGLDGTLANKENPLYNEMVNRADFIFFVQSTTSAINEATSDFLVYILKDRLSDVPMHLIHNVHESIYFKSDKSINEMVDRQVTKGIQCIRDKFNMPNLTFKNHIFNFAKISAGVFESSDIKPAYRDMITCETAEFNTSQSEIIATLQTDRRAIKDRANITKSLADLSHAASELKEIREQINGVISTYRGIQIKVNGVGLNLTINREALMATINGVIASENIQNLWDAAIVNITNNIQTIEMSGKDLKAKIDLLAVDYAHVNPMRRGTTFQLSMKSIVEKYIIDALAQTASDALKVINEYLPNAAFSQTIDCSTLDASVTFQANYYNIKEKKLRLFTKSYNSATVATYIQSYRNDSRNALPNKITSYVTQLEAKIVDFVNDYANKIDKELSKFKIEIDKSCQKKIDLFEEQLSLVNKFIEDIEK